MMNNTMLMSRMMAEDCGAPELRSPYTSGVRRTRSFWGWFMRRLRA